MDKYCGKCERFKDTDEFRKNRTRVDGLQSWCKTCSNRANTMSESVNGTEERNKQRYMRRKDQRDRVRATVVDFLEKHPCVDCGEDDVLVLEFDHVRGRKRANIGTLINRCKSVLVVMREIAKCVVRCANCHRRKTGQTAWRLSSSTRRGGGSPSPLPALRPQ